MVQHALPFIGPEIEVLRLFGEIASKMLYVEASVFALPDPYVVQRIFSRGTGCPRQSYYPDWHCGYLFLR